MRIIVRRFVARRKHIFVAYFVAVISRNMLSSRFPHPVRAERNVPNPLGVSVVRPKSCRSWVWLWGGRLWPPAAFSGGWTRWKAGPRPELPAPTDVSDLRTTLAAVRSSSNQNGISLGFHWMWRFARKAAGTVGPVATREPIVLKGPRNPHTRSDVLRSFLSGLLYTATAQLVITGG